MLARQMSGIATADLLDEASNLGIGCRVQVVGGVGFYKLVSMALQLL